MIVQNALQCSNTWCYYGDHTTGSGMMMAVNGYIAESSDTILWEQTVSVDAQTDYLLSAWVSTAVELGDPTPLVAELHFFINDVEMGFKDAPDNVCPELNGAWEEFSARWNSGFNTNAKITIKNSTSGGAGE